MVPTRLLQSLANTASFLLETLDLLHVVLFRIDNLNAHFDITLLNLFVDSFEYPGHVSPVVYLATHSIPRHSFLQFAQQLCYVPSPEGDIVSEHSEVFLFEVLGHLNGVRRVGRVVQVGEGRPLDPLVLVGGELGGD